MGANGMGSGVVDGFFFDDAWRDTPSPGSNACDGSPIGGPSEVDSACVEDMGLRQEDTTALTAGWAANLAATHAAVNAAGGFNWNQFTQVGAPANSSGAACLQFFSAACGPQGAYLNAALLQTYTEAPGRVFDPLPAFESDLATFLLIRGPAAWLGFSWTGSSRGTEAPACRWRLTWGCLRRCARRAARGERPRNFGATLLEASAAAARGGAAAHRRKNKERAVV